MTGYVVILSNVSTGSVRRVRFPDYGRALGYSRRFRPARLRPEFWRTEVVPVRVGAPRGVSR